MLKYFLLFLVVSSIHSTQAQPGNAGREKFALIFTRLPAVEGEERVIARNNLQAIREALAIQGFREQNIIADTINSSRSGFLRQCNSLEQKIRPGDFVFVYFDIPLTTGPVKDNRIRLHLNPSNSLESIGLDEYQNIQDRIAHKIRDSSIFFTLFDADLPSAKIDYRDVSDQMTTSLVFATSPGQSRVFHRQTSIFAKAVSAALKQVSDFNYSYLSLFANIKKQMLLYSGQQTPYYAGTSRMVPLFNGLARSFPSHLLVIEKPTDSTIFINAGSNINLLPGAIIKIYPAFEDTGGSAILTEGTVEKTTGYSSTVKLKKPFSASLDYAWAYVVKNGEDPPLKIKFNESFEGDARSRQMFGQIMAALKRSGLSDYADLVPAGGDLKIKSIHSGYGTGLLLTLVNPVSGQVYTDINCYSPEDTRNLETFIQQLARYQYLSRLKNEIPELGLDIRINHMDPGKTPLKENGYDVFFENDKVFMTFYNNTPNRIYFSLIDMQIDKPITLLFPNEQMKNSSGFPAPVRSSDCVVEPFDSVSFKNSVITITPPFGIERFKLFTSLTPIHAGKLLSNHEISIKEQGDAGTIKTPVGDKASMPETGAPVLNNIAIRDFDIEIRSRLFETGAAKSAENMVSMTTAGTGTDDLPSFKITNPSGGRIYYNVLSRNSDGGYQLLYPENSDKSTSCFVERGGSAWVVLKNGILPNEPLITVYADRPFNLNDFVTDEKSLNVLLVDIIRNNRITGTPLNKISMIRDLYMPEENNVTRDGENVFIKMVTPKITDERGVTESAQGPSYDINGFALCAGNKPVKSVTINGKPVNYDAGLKFFEHSVSLAPGENKIVIEAAGEKGFTATRVFNLSLKNNNAVASTAPARNFFLGIGIDNYKTWPRLNNAKNDILAFTRLIEKRFGFDPSNIELLLDTAATRKNIINRIRGFLKKTGPNDNVVIYLSGHGNEDQLSDGGYYFIPQDADADDVSTAVKSSDIIDPFEHIRARKCLLIVDACFAGMITNAVNENNTKMTSAENKINPEDQPAKWIITSGRATKVSDGEKGKNSPFATVLTNYLWEQQEKDLLLTKLIGFLAEKMPEINNQQVPMGLPIEGRSDKFFKVTDPAAKKE